MEPDDLKRFEAFELSFRELYVRDLVHADAGDVRMGTFVLCVAFLDALSLAYSAGMKVPGGKRGKWKRFMRDYLRCPYEPIWDSYESFRNRLLHNYGAQGIAFTHGAEQAGLHLARANEFDVVVLHRETFVRDVIQAFEDFATDIRANAELRSRVYGHFGQYPPMGLIGYGLDERRG